MESGHDLISVLCSLSATCMSHVQLCDKTASHWQLSKLVLTGLEKINTGSHNGLDTETSKERYTVDEN